VIFSILNQYGGRIRQVFVALYDTNSELIFACKKGMRSYLSKIETTPHCRSGDMAQFLKPAKLPLFLFLPLSDWKGFP